MDFQKKSKLLLSYMLALAKKIVLSDIPFLESISVMCKIQTELGTR
jgi:hypothetical protein